MVGKGNNIKCVKCGITSKENPLLTFHRFPLPSMHGSLKARVWAKFCFPNDDWTTDEALVMLHKQHKMLCGNHFDNASFTSSAKTRLNKFAIPTEAQSLLVLLRDEPPKNMDETGKSKGLLKDLDVKKFSELTSRKQELYKKCRQNLTEIGIETAKEIPKY